MSARLGAILPALLIALLPPPAAAARPVPAGLDPGRPLDAFELSSWSADDGLPSNALTNVLQTADGYLWVASFSGLARFDGLEFTVFDRRTTPGLATDGFHELVEAGDGTLWIGTQGAGLLTYRDGVFASPLAGEQARLTVRAILIDDAGEIWVGSDDGAFRYRDGILVPVDHPALREVIIRDLFQDRAGDVLFATEGNGLVRLAGGRFSVLTAAAGLASDDVTALAQSADGTVWIGTADGLSRLDDDGLRPVPALTGHEIYRLYVDDYDSLWLATEQGLLRRGPAGAIERLEDRVGRPLRSISAVAFDREGTVWVASYADGLYQIWQGKLRGYSTADGLAGSRVNAIAETTPGTVLIGVDGGRIDVVRGGVVRAIEPPLPLPDVRVRGILPDRDGLWVSSYAGLLKREAGVDELYTAADGLPTDRVRLAHRDRAGRLWLATRDAGLLRREAGGGFVAVDRSAGLGSDFVLSIADGPGGTLLVGTHEGGLAILHADGTIALYGIADGLPGGIVFSARADDEGAIWVATNGGLARLREGEIGAVTAAAGLPAEAVFDYREDGRGGVWLSSSLGVIQVAKEELVAVVEGALARIDATLYDERDGMASRECTGAAKILESAAGELWFPTLDGVAVVDPARIARNPVPPRVEIAALRVDGERVDRRSSELVIEPGAREYRFEFAALSFLAPSRVEVRYRLEGFDDDWVDAGGERRVRYTSLPPGEYVFRVIAANGDGVWNREGATLVFRVRPSFYQRPLFLLVVALALAAGAGGLWRWGTRAVRAHNLELARTVDEQRRAEREHQRLIEELEARNEEMERFTYTVSHDLKSPLVTIKGFLGILRRDVKSGRLERLEHDVKRIGEAADRMRRLLDELLELSRVGRIVNPPHAVPLDELAREAVELLAGPIAERGVEVVIAPDLPVLRGDRTRLLELIQNLIENAVRYLGDQPSPRIEIGCRRDGEDPPCCYVRDNGIGIEPLYHDKIFGLFERLDPGGEGTGIGLALARRIVEVHGGRIWVESDGPGRGSTFCFVLPEDDGSGPNRTSGAESADAAPEATR